MMRPLPGMTPPNGGKAPFDPRMAQPNAMPVGQPTAMGPPAQAMARPMPMQRPPMAAMTPPPGGFQGAGPGAGPSGPALGQLMRPQPMGREGMINALRKRGKQRRG